MRYTESAAQGVACLQCGGDVAAGLLVCPSCGALMKSAELNALAQQAQAAAASGDVRAEIGCWRGTLELLPAGSVQHGQVLARVQELSKSLDSGSVPPPPPPVVQSRGAGVAPPPPPPPPVHAEGKAKAKGGIMAILGVIGMILLKSKTLLVLLLTKGKMLLVGLKSGTTFLTMFLSFGVYWSLWGWKFAAGLVVGIYIHEMGHVWALRKLGIKATAPMFIPGLGALVRLKQNPADAREDARIGLAGPLWGLAASVGALGMFWVTGAPIWAAITRVNAWINLFNLIPIFPLDGGRGMRALVKWQRWCIAGAFGAAWVATHDGLLILLGIVAVVMALRPAEEAEGDKKTFGQYVFLIAALAAILLVHVPGTPLHR